MLSPEELSRYSRNILLDEVRRAGQEKLKSSKICIVGAGGLGSPALFYLSAAGVGNITIIDSDEVDTTNLQRQILYRHSDIGAKKAETASRNSRELNPFVQIASHAVRLSSENADSLLQGFDLVLEGSDNFGTKFLVNDSCVRSKIPFLTAGVLRFEGMVMGVRPGVDACFRCVFESEPPPESVPSCSEAGVIGSVAGLIGSIQATEAIKFLLEFPNVQESGLFGNMIQVETKNMEFRKIRLERRLDCPCCG
ncbi:HesA/MoeB/ThiF family protein [Leptospira fletcheri]|uniref:Molybdopterin-synthase adenylyltransferase n=1 Tax=Leptospira fletcheri TaxID=2484981 RepID=A0A4R9GH14_9LEPT|nr:HesA/MoeB/ThiF family protein [Leptospira fletcheri]TGK12022.1 HesA/MoeB/ThiF family protein [Leptospira fletcheri]